MTFICRSPYYHVIAAAMLQMRTKGQMAKSQQLHELNMTIHKACGCLARSCSHQVHVKTVPKARHRTDASRKTLSFTSGLSAEVFAMQPQRFSGRGYC